MNDKIENAFTYHASQGTQPERYVQLREKAKELAYLIDNLVPVSREQSLALTNLEQATFWANAGIARNEWTQKKPSWGRCCELLCSMRNLLL